MWSRIDLKDKAKFNVQSFYWKSVLVAFLLNFVTRSGGSSNGRDNNSNDTNAVTHYIRNVFTNRWIALVLGLAVIMIVVFITLAIVTSIFLLGPLEVSCKKYFLDASNGTADLNRLTYAFKSNYLNIVKTIFMRNLFTFLWFLLLIIPGIIKTYEYRMIPYLLCENPNLSFNEARAISAQMMDGEKWDTFVLDLSFILWHILSAVTFGLVGIFWVGPYTAYTDVELFKALSPKRFASNNTGYQSTF